jgi:hypothetical protein
MARIKLNDNEFSDVIVAYLLDMMIEKGRAKKDLDNILFDTLIEDLFRKGMLPIFRKYYLTMDPTNRRKYKIIKEGVSPYDDTTENAVIAVVPADFEEKPKKETFKKVKKTIKSTLGKLVGDSECTADDIPMILEEIQEELLDG